MLSTRRPLDRRITLRSNSHHPRGVRGLGGAALNARRPPVDRRITFRSNLHHQKWAGLGRRRAYARGAPPLGPKILSSVPPAPPLEWCGFRRSEPNSSACRGLTCCAGGPSVAFQRRRCLRCVSAQEFVFPPLRFSAGGPSDAFQRRRCLRCVSTQEIVFPPLRFSAGGVSVAFCAGDCNQPH